MISVQYSESIANSLTPGALPEAFFEVAALAALEESGSPEGDLTIVVSDDTQVRELNRQYLEIDEPTDVLSFPADYTDPDTGSPYLGDIIISFPRAQEQAASAGHAVEHELQLLVVHGVLHLLGHDHGEGDEKATMWAAQSAALKRLQNPLSPP